ncbi:vWA domain-containing protein [Glaciecola petra]|uniref:VWA domain-containing protein n=1 Tax=Glaciecola petra TaxID=3075602 RepID=A0ABU2ZQT8_9ALTE|nr:VWA domain-containing protein [Aestuariibacter sp. P117]MDT0594992.1 VWA domain-containing protein [Aestuariibacter sp. P117]
MPTNTLKLSLLSLTILTVFSCAGPIQESEQAKKEQSAAQHESLAETELIELDKVEAPKNRSLKDESLAKQAHVQNLAMTSHAMRIRTPIMDHIGPIPNTENYQDIEENGVHIVSENPLSTFSVDVDTGSYTNSRRLLNQGYLPPEDAVRVEEFINYFDYAYPSPTVTETPFSVNTAISVAPWNKERHILRIGLKGYEPELKANIGRNLVFLLDVSGSMNQANKLPLLKRSLTMLTNQLNEKDSVSIVVYAGASGVVLEPTKGNNKIAITAALNKLSAGGSTNGASGIQLAYRLAEQAFVEKGVNRVILATDGDFNVGMTDQNALIKLIETKREKGIALTTLGFGQGNYNDYLMEQLADAGNGNYAYIDTINEARKVLVDELQSTMQIIAKDVKIQVEFNPNQVAEYRLIGYENRKLAKEDFNNDKVDAGDIGAGHSVTALYELTLLDSKEKFNDELRYQTSTAQTETTQLNQELAFIKLRFKQPQESKSDLIEQSIGRQQITTFAEQTPDFKFATAVAGFAQLMKKSKYVQDIDYQWITETAQQAKGNDEYGYRSEFIQLVRNANELSEYSAVDSSDDDSSAVESRSIENLKVNKRNLKALTLVHQNKS